MRRALRAAVHHTDAMHVTVVATRRARVCGGCGDK